MSDEVPVGTVQEVLCWVGDDPDRAAAALEAEHNGAQRTTLIAKLEATASQPEERDTMSETDTTYEPPEGTRTGTTLEPPEETEGIPAPDPEPPQETEPDTEPDQPEETEPDTAPEPPEGTGTTGEIGSVDETETAEETEEVPAPEPPTVVELRPNDEDVTVGVVHRRDADVEVADGSDLLPDDPDDDEFVISAEAVEYFQVAGSPNGVVIALNGQAFALLPQTTASLKGALDRAVAGLAL